MPTTKKSAKSGKAHSASVGKKKTAKSKKSAKSRDTPPEGYLRREPTVFDPPAMDNLYYIAHSAGDALSIRGFGWSSGVKKKKGGGRKGMKKK